MAKKEKKVMKRIIEKINIEKKRLIPENNIGNRILYKYYRIIIKYLMIIDLIIQATRKNKLFLIKSNSSKIALKIKGIGQKNIFNSSFRKYYYQNEIYINGEKQNTVNNSYIFNKTHNYVELIWNNMINNTVSMFGNCKDITEIDLSNFDSSQLMYTYYMFYGCTSLTSINMNNLVISNIVDMEEMFYNCSMLSTINLSNFDTSKVTWINNLFDGCINLEYINLNKFNEMKLNSSSSGYYNNIFSKVPDNVVICINENNNQNIILPQIKQKTCYTIDCFDDWRSKQKKIVTTTGKCVNSCDEETQYKYEYNSKCYDNCQNGFLVDNNNIAINKCKCFLEKCLTCSHVALNLSLCNKCNTNFYPMENDTSNLGEYINCYKNLQGYYLDKDDLLFKKCYDTCETCETKGNNITHNCLSCNKDFPINISFNNYTNCYLNCTYYFYFDQDNNYLCTKNSSCPHEFPKLDDEKRQCIKNDIKNMIQNIIKYEKNETESEEKMKEEEVKYYDQIIENIEAGFTSDNYDTSNLDKGEDEVIETEKMTVTFTTTQNQKDNTNNNMSSIDLGECEKLLRNYYNISDNETLYMKKVDIIQEGVKTPKIEYDVYCKLKGNKLEKLNISTVCGDSKISLSIPLELSDDIDKLNTSSGYYNDICYVATSESGTDISLKDRKKEYFEDNKVVCQEDCDFSEYDTNTQKATCSCQVKESSTSFADMTINTTKLYENFADFKNIVNLKILVCSKILFTKSGLVKNIGSYIILVIIIFHIICMIIFYVKQLKTIFKKIKDIIFGFNFSNY